MTHDLRALLLDTGLFGGLGDNDLTLIEEVILRKKIEPGDYLFKEGDPYDGFYLMGSGKVEVVKESSSDNEEVLVVLERGQVFGEIALFLEEGKRVASARGAQSGDCYFMPLSVFKDFVENENPTAYRMVLSMARILSKRLDRMNHEIVKLAEKERSQTHQKPQQDLSVLKKQLTSSWTF